MLEFIKDLYYGKIDVQARSFLNNPKLTEQMEIIEINNDLLSDSLSDDTKELFEDFSTAWDIVNHETNLDSFINGFRLGAKFAYDAFASSSSPLCEL